MRKLSSYHVIWNGNGSELVNILGQIIIEYGICLKILQNILFHNTINPVLVIIKEKTIEYRDDILSQINIFINLSNITQRLSFFSLHAG